VSYVLKTRNARGEDVITPFSEGGLFVEVIGRSAGEGALSKTYPSLYGMTLRVIQVSAGPFTWSTGVDGAGNPYINLSPQATTILGGSTTLLVFAL
jgi:hypothetical protein